jgi:hypothetical protein
MPTETQVEDVQMDATSDQQQVADTSKQQPTRAQQRLQELANERKTLAEQLEAANQRLTAYDDEKRKKDEADALARGEHEKLLGEERSKHEKLQGDFKVLKERALRFEAALKNLLTREMEPLTDAQRKLVPPGLDIDAQLQWLWDARDAGLFNNSTPPSAPNMHAQHGQQQQNGSINLNDPAQVDAIKRKFRI